MTHFRPLVWRHNPSTHRFIFATGIECSYPTIDVNGSRHRVDELAKCGHYDRWREDFELVRQLGITYLRYGLPYYRIHTAQGTYQWDFADLVMPAMRDMGIIPILDLCHFGVPDWIGDFQNPDFPEHFANFARTVAQRYPWVLCFTPINEMYITAEFSAYYGWWNERRSDHRSFVTALKHLAKACVLAMEAIIEVNPQALFIHAESSERTHARQPELVDEAEMYNERRFLSMDLVCGRMVSSGMYQYLREHGMTEEEYLFFLDHRLTEHFIMGHDYYEANEHLLIDETTRTFLGDIFGYDTLARHYCERYQLPVMHTETNAVGPHAVRWLWKTWHNIQELRRAGSPICGMTWYSLTHQMDWDTALRENNGNIHPVGLFDLDRKITPVGEAYKELITLWKETPLLPNGPLTLVGKW